MAFSTVLTPTAGVPGRSYGTFSGKGAGNPPVDPGGGGKVYSGAFSTLVPTAGMPGRRYGSFAKGDAAPPPTPEVEAIRTGGGRGNKRRRAIVDGVLVEGTENIRAALTRWADRLDNERSKPVEKPKPRPRVKAGAKEIDAPRVSTLTEQDAIQFAEALRSIKTREDEVERFLAQYRAMIDDEDAWLILN